MIAIVIALGAVFCGIIGAFVGSTKGLDIEGFWLGFLLGPIGIVVVAVMGVGEPNRPQAESSAGQLRERALLAEVQSAPEPWYLTERYGWQPRAWAAPDPAQWRPTPPAPVLR